MTPPAGEAAEPATADIRKNTMAEPYGFHLQGEPILHFARTQDVLFWPLKPLPPAG